MLPRHVLDVFDDCTNIGGRTGGWVEKYKNSDVWLKLGREGGCENFKMLTVVDVVGGRMGGSGLVRVLT